MGNRVYGCDDCLAVCPWNKWAQAGREAKLQARADLETPRLADWLALDEAGFRRLFAGSPVKRIGHARFGRNLLIAAGNSADPTLIPAVATRLDDPSPLVRAMAVWALGQLETAANLANLLERVGARETDPAVRAEWAALAASNPLPARLPSP